MNQNTIVKFKLGSSKGLFVSIPYSFKNFSILKYSMAETYLVETESKKLNNWKIKIPEGDYRYIGRSNELSPELIEDLLKVPFMEYINILNKFDVTVNYSDNSNFWAVLLNLNNKNEQNGN